MKVGVNLFATDSTVGIDELAVELEKRGLESLWVPEHTHIPVSRRSPYLRGADLPPQYARCLDPFVALATAAAVTRTLRLGTGVCLLAQHDTLVAAKQVATLDLLSGGRISFGVGLGWNIEEMEDHGVDPATRRSKVREQILAMKGLWAEDEFEFQGRFVSFERSWQWPKPIQHPGPPVLLAGAATPRAIRHLAEYADGWMPDLNIVRFDALAQAMEAIAAACEDAGRGRSAVSVTAQGLRARPDDIARLAALGVERAVHVLPSAGWNEVHPALDALQQAVEAARL